MLKHCPKNEQLAEKQSFEATVKFSVNKYFSSVTNASIHYHATNKFFITPHLCVQSRPKMEQLGLLGPVSRKS